MGKRRIRAGGAAAALAVTLGLSACGGPGAPVAPAAVDAAVPTAGRPLSDSTLSYLSRPQSHYEVVPTDPVAARPKVSVDRAVEVANQQVIGAGAPAQMSLVRYTNKVAPAKAQPGGAKKPGLAVDDRLAWALVYDGFQQAAAVAPTYVVKNGTVVAVPPKAKAVPAAPVTSLVMFVDAVTGSYIEALTMGR